MSMSEDINEVYVRDGKSSRSFRNPHNLAIYCKYQENPAPIKTKKHPRMLLYKLKDFSLLAFSEELTE